MSVTLTPSNQLGFERPLTLLVKKVLTLKNTNNSPICFKIKTTAPRLYVVRPNSGRIEPNESVEVQVLLQPMKEDPPAGTKCRDKFLVQSVLITPERENASLSELWTVIEQEDKALSDKSLASIHEQKIRCVYLSAPDEMVLPIKEEVIQTPISNSTTSSTEQISSTNSTPSDSATNAPILESSTLSNIPSSILPSRSSSITSPQIKTESLPTTTIPTTSTASSEEITALRLELSSAQAEVKKLRQQIIDSEIMTNELRKRTVAVESESKLPPAQVAVQTKQSTGVPPVIVVGIVVVVFVSTWLLL